MIKFICWKPNESIKADDRQEAIKMIQKGYFSNYDNVVVFLPSGESFNLESLRAKEYFGIKR